MQEIWKTTQESTRQAAGPLAAAAAWNMGEWASMEEYQYSIPLSIFPPLSLPPPFFDWSGILEP
jgi:hypothetical protein